MQPEVLIIDKTLRLKKAQETDIDDIIEWYQDLSILKYVDGLDATVYDRETVIKMFKYLRDIGEFYVIQIYECNFWKTIGDITLSPDTMPIVIGKEKYWGQGIGKKVITSLLNRAKELGYKKIRLKEIFNFNKRSYNLFSNCGFTEIEKNNDITIMEIKL